MSFLPRSDTPKSERPRVTGASAFRYAAFRRVWFGQAANVIGDNMFSVAIALFVLHRRDAARTLSLILGVYGVAKVASLILGGVWADRYRRSRMILVSDGMRAAGVTSILLAGSQAPVVALLIGAVVLGVGTGVYKPAYASLTSSVVPDSVVVSANSVWAVTNRIGMVGGALLGGLIASATSPRVCLWVDLGTFVVSSLTLFQVRDGTPLLEGVHPGLVVAARDGLRYVWKRRWIAAVMAQGTVQSAFVISPLGLVLPLLIGPSSSTWYGVVVGSEALGGAVGAALAVRLRPRRRGLTALCGLLVQVPELGLVALHAPPLEIALAGGVTGVGLGLFAVLWTSALRLQVPPEFLARIFALDSLTFTVLNPVGYVFAGWLVMRSGISAVAWIALAILIMSAIVPLGIPGVAEFQPPTDLGGASRDRRWRFWQRA